jgi:hypothetical protein
LLHRDEERVASRRLRPFLQVVHRHDADLFGLGGREVRQEPAGPDLFGPGDDPDVGGRDSGRERERKSDADSHGDVTIGSSMKLVE